VYFPCDFVHSRYRGGAQGAPAEGEAFDLAREYWGPRQSHRSLHGLMQFLLAEQRSAASPLAPHVVVMTFSAIEVDLVNQPHLRPPTAAGAANHAALRPEVLSLGAFHLGSDFQVMTSSSHRISSHHLTLIISPHLIVSSHLGFDFQDAVEAYYDRPPGADAAGEPTSPNVLLVQCGLPKTSAAQIHRAKHMCLEVREARLGGCADKAVVFLVHLQKDFADEGVLHPFSWHAEREWRYATLDAVEEPAVQGVPEVSQLLTAKVHGLFAEGRDPKLPLAMLRAGLRKCLSKLSYPPELQFSVRERMDLLEALFDRDPDVVAAIMARIRPVYDEAAARELAPGWQVRIWTTHRASPDSN
jgi:hypothetical protein